VIKIKVASRWPCRPVLLAAFINCRTSSSVKYSRGRTSQFLGLRGGDFPENDAWRFFFERLIARRFDLSAQGTFSKTVAFGKVPAS